MGLEMEELTERIIGAALDVHRQLGPGFVESIYENALVVELRARDVPFQRQITVPVLYRGVEVGLHRLDLLAFDEIVVELKAVNAIENAHFVVLRSYLRAARRKHGLLLNFAKPTLGIKRVSTQRDAYPPSFPGFLGSFSSLG